MVDENYYSHVNTNLLARIPTNNEPILEIGWGFDNLGKAYGEHGLLDITYLRFFTLNSMVTMFTETISRIKASFYQYAITDMPGF